MKFIKIPIRFNNGEYSEEGLKDMLENDIITDIDSVTDTGYVSVNPNNLVAFNESTEGTVTMGLPDGRWDVPLTIKQFEELFNITY